MRRKVLQRFWLASKCGAASLAKLARMAASPARSAANFVACKQRRKLCDERCESREASEDRCKPCEERRESCQALRGALQALPRFKLASSCGLRGAAPVAARWQASARPARTYSLAGNF